MEQFRNLWQELELLREENSFLQERLEQLRELVNEEVCHCLALLRFGMTDEALLEMQELAKNTEACNES